MPPPMSHAAIPICLASHRNRFAWSSEYVYVPITLCSACHGDVFARSWLEAIFDPEGCSPGHGDVPARSWTQVFLIWNGVLPIMGICSAGHGAEVLQTGGCARPVNGWRYFRSGMMFTRSWGYARSAMDGGIFDMERCSLCPGDVSDQSWLEAFLIRKGARLVMGMCPPGHGWMWRRHGDMFGGSWAGGQAVMGMCSPGRGQEAGRLWGCLAQTCGCLVQTGKKAQKRPPVPQWVPDDA
jgi:hypothetical protein